jgi:S-adenosylhomocysteine hydrolase
MSKAKSIYVLINGRVINRPAAEDCPWSLMALTYAVTVLDGRSLPRIMKECHALSLADHRPSLGV